MFYIEDENEENRYNYEHIILQVKQMIENRKADIEKILANNIAELYKILKK